jgi:RNA polymerase sigma-70 factor (ECF subfamily)
MPERPSDEILMVQFKKGDVHAFETLLGRHKRGVFAFILRFCNDRHTAEELLQDVFLRVVDNAQKFEQRSKFTTWLYAIARNLCIDHLRKMRHRKTTSLDQPCNGADEEGMTLGQRIRSDKPEPDEQAHLLRLQQHIRRAVKQLSPEQREVFLLREEAGLPFDQIARIVKAPANTVKSRMRYALLNLRTSLQAAGVIP